MTIVFSIVVITALLTILGLEYSNLLANENINAVKVSVASSKMLASSLFNQYFLLTSLNPSSAASSFFAASLGDIAQSFYPNYDINMSSGSVSQNGIDLYAIPYAPITISNTQSAGTASPFQQYVTVNSSKYLQFENPSLSNVQFSYPNGTVVDSWMESGNLAGMNGASYILLPKGFPNGLSSYTINIWVRPSNASYGAIVNTGDGNCALGAIYGNPGNPLTVSAWNRGLSGYWMSATTNVSLAIGSWSMLTETLSGGSVGKGTIKIYINGNPEDTLSLQSINYSGSTSQLIGGGYTCSALVGSFIGGEADYQFYNTTLSPTQIGRLFSENMGGSPQLDAGLEGWWPLAGNTNDASGNGNSGTATNVQYSEAGAGSTSTIYWLKLNRGLPANSQTVVNMNLYADRNNMLNNITTGEAPQLSPIYGEYDNGAKIFNYYTNFAGTSLPSGWYIPSGEVSPKINNGMFIPAGNCSQAAYNSSSLYGQIMEAYSEELSGQTAGWSDLGLSNSTNKSIISWAESSSTNTVVAPDNVTSGYVPHVLTPSEPTGIYAVYGVLFSPNAAVWYYNDVYAQSTYSVPGPKAILLYNGGSCTSGGGNAINTYWIRTRAFPPDLVMPSTYIGGLQ